MTNFKKKKKTEKRRIKFKLSVKFNNSIYFCLFFTFSKILHDYFYLSLDIRAIIIFFSRSARRLHYRDKYTFALKNYARAEKKC